MMAAPVSKWWECRVPGCTAERMGYTRWCPAHLAALRAGRASHAVLWGNAPGTWHNGQPGGVDAEHPYPASVLDGVTLAPKFTPIDYAARAAVLVAGHSRGPLTSNYIGHHLLGIGTAKMRQVVQAGLKAGYWRVLPQGRLEITTRGRSLAGAGL